MIGNKILMFSIMFERRATMLDFLLPVFMNDGSLPLLCVSKNIDFSSY